MTDITDHKLKTILFCIEMAITGGLIAYQHPDYKPEYIDLKELHKELKA